VSDLQEKNVLTFTISNKFSKIYTFSIKFIRVVDVDTLSYKSWSKFENFVSEQN